MIDGGSFPKDTNMSFVYLRQNSFLVAAKFFSDCAFLKYSLKLD